MALRSTGSPEPNESDPEKRRDLLQEIHFSIWRSFTIYDTRCSLRTWIYRLAHNTAATYVVRQRRLYTALVSLEELDELPAQDRSEAALDRHNASERLFVLIQRLNPLDRQVIVSYLEDIDAVSIGEITGLSPPHVAVKIHRSVKSTCWTGWLAPARASPASGEGEPPIKSGHLECSARARGVRKISHPPRRKMSIEAAKPDK